MVSFIVRRILYIILVLFIVSFFIFMLFRTTPGDPVDMFLPPEVQMAMERDELEMARAELIETMGLDQPHVIQYFYWLAAMFRGDFGMSIQSRISVIDHVRGPMANTIVINIINMVIIFSITIPVGVYSAIKRGKTFDNVALVGSVIGFAIPGFLFALLVIVFLVILPPWNFFPMFGMASVIPPPAGTWAWYADRLRHMALPLLSMVLMGMAGLIRFTRSAMIDALNMDCIRTARAKGLSEKVVIYVHAFRNALIPIITITAGTFVGIFGGSIIIETIFAWQGMGHVMITALNVRDIGVLMAMNVFYALISFTAILVLDILYAVVDPRIRFS
jgi:peptide/nickel transport system permease protein